MIIKISRSIYCIIILLIGFGVQSANGQNTTLETVQKTEKTYFAFAQVVVDNGTLIITPIKEVNLPNTGTSKDERQVLLGFNALNNPQFLKKVSSQYGKLLEKTRIPSTYNSITISSNKDEVLEARNLWLSKKENNIIHVPDFEFLNNKNETASSKKIVIN
ncbi:hypothetical protein ACFCT7_16570 [Fulvivirgaceae bacterium LMO-SS25]